MRPFRYYGGRWTGDGGLETVMESVEIWKIKNFPHYHPFHNSTTAGERRFKKNSFFYFYGGRETQDERRKTRDEGRETRDERTHTPSQATKAEKHTQNIAQNWQAKFKQNDSFV